MQENGFVKKPRLNVLFMTSETGKEIITIYIFPIIPRSKGNQMIKFGQLIEYKMRNSFLQKSCRK